jgi:hypothetical protein
VKFINNILYLAFSDLTGAGVSDNTIRNAQQRGNSGWVFIANPQDGRSVLVEYEPLPAKYKEIIQAKFGNPYQYISRQSITQHLIAKQDDVQLIEQYRLPNHQLLSTNHQRQYIDACMYLHLLDRVNVSNVREYGFDTMATFNSSIQQLIKANSIKLPTAYTKLRDKVNKYREIGALAVIKRNFGSKNAAKLGNVQLAFVRQLHAKANQYSSPQIAEIYNKAAAENNWPTVTAQAIYAQISKVEVKQQLIGLREGMAEFRNAYDFIVSRIRPSRPGMLWVGDGTPYELYYQAESINKKGHREVKYWLRKYVYVVIDAFNDAVMGYAIGDVENVDLARLAWRNACVNMGILPDQVKTDNFATGALKTFYAALALNKDHYTPSATYNARDKVIEPFFGRIFNKITKHHDNFSGHNITAKQQPNRDYLNAIRHHFPNEAGVIAQIQQDMYSWNASPRQKYGKKVLNGQSLIEDWKATATTARQLTEAKRLELFGQLHTHRNKLTNKGLEVTLGGQTRIYALNSPDFAQTIGKQYQVIFDSGDYSNIMVVADEGRTKFVLPEFAPIPMAMGDFKGTEGERTRLNTVLAAKKQRMADIYTQNQYDMELIEAHGALKGHFTIQGQQKGILNTAEAAIKELPQGEKQILAPQILRPDIYDDED